jgi:hypothetical protein
MAAESNRPTITGGGDVPLSIGGLEVRVEVSIIYELD